MVDGSQEVPPYVPSQERSEDKELNQCYFFAQTKRSDRDLCYKDRLIKLNLVFFYKSLKGDVPA